MIGAPGDILEGKVHKHLSSLFGSRLKQPAPIAPVHAAAVRAA
jgi:hypothetical protein